MDSIKLFVAQQGRRDVILFNNGLHGWHLEDHTAYRVAYENMGIRLIEEFVDVPLILVLTTHIRDAQREQRVIARNQIALEIAEKNNLKIIDLYTEALKNHDDLDESGVHFGEKGNLHLARKILNDVDKVLGW